MTSQLTLFPAPALMCGGCFRRSDAIAAGLSHDQITRRVQAGELRQVLRGVYVDSARPEDLTLRAEALALLLPRAAAVGRRSAAWLHGFDARAPGSHEEVPEAECVVPAPHAPVRVAGVRSYVASLAASELQLVQGVLCTTALRTAVDLLRWCPGYVALGVVDGMVRRRMCDVGDLREAVEEWRGMRNVAVARRLASLVDAGAESPGESWLRLRLADAGFPRPQLQIPLPRGGQVVFRLDLGWPEHRIALEYDGVEWHTSRRQREKDEQRRRIIREEFGWTVVPVTRGDVLGSRMLLEKGVGDLLGLEPQVWRRLW